MSDIVEPKKYTIPRDTFNDAFFPYLRSNARTEIFYGGGGSGKSYFLAQRDILDVLGKAENNVLIMSKVAAANHNTTFSDLCFVIDNWNRKYFNNTLASQFHINHSKGDERIICKRTGNAILFGGCKDDNELEKIKGIRAPNGPITHVRCEEMTNFSQRDIYQLFTVRLRGETKGRKRATGSMNPILATHFIKKEYIDNAPKDTLFYEHGNTNAKAIQNNPNLVVLKTTHEDNKFYGEEERKELLKFKDIDKYYYDVYVLGNWGVLGNIVFNNYIIEDFEYTLDDLENVFSGMDYGYVHASAIELGGFKDGELYVCEETYGKKLTNQDFIDTANEQYAEDHMIHYLETVADSAEQDRIEEWNRNGYKVVGAKKGPGSLKFGVDYLVSIPKIHIHASKCPNLAREIQTFKRKEDKNGDAMESFVEINDDTIAALRYGTEYIWSNQGQYLDTSPGGFTLSDLGL
jgi:phage terminase large subunit